MMVCVSVTDLLPGAHEQDESGGTLTTAYVFGGMLVMAASIALLRVA